MLGNEWEDHGQVKREQQTKCHISMSRMWNESQTMSSIGRNQWKQSWYRCKEFSEFLWIGLAIYL